MESLEANSLEFRNLRRELDAIGKEFLAGMDGLAYSIAHRWSTSAKDFEDLLQEGRYTIWEHFLTWDPAKAEFSTFVMASLSGDVARLQAKLNQHGSFRNTLGRSHVMAAVAEMQERLGRSPSNGEVSMELGMSLDRVALLRKGGVVSLDARVRNDDSDSRGEALTRKDLLVMETGEIGEVALDDLMGLISDQVDTKTLAGGDKVEQIWLGALNKATAELSIRELVLLIRRDGLDGWEPEKIVQLAGRLELGREMLRRTEAKARESIEARGLRLPSDLS